jgi:hypothetical protein
MVESQQQGPFYQISDTKNADLLRERQSSTFDVEQLSQFLFGGLNNYFNINKRRQISTINSNFFDFIFFSSIQLVKLMHILFMIPTYH